MTAKKAPKLLPECEAIIEDVEPAPAPTPDTEEFAPIDADLGITQVTPLRQALGILIRRYGVKAIIGSLSAIYSERVKEVTCQNSKTLFSKTSDQLRKLYEEIM